MSTSKLSLSIIIQYTILEGMSVVVFHFWPKGVSPPKKKQQHKIIVLSVKYEEIFFLHLSVILPTREELCSVCAVCVST